jgi:hypothetical protein
VSLPRAGGQVPVCGKDRGGELTYAIAQPDQDMETAGPWEKCRLPVARLAAAG